MLWDLLILVGICRAHGGVYVLQTLGIEPHYRNYSGLYDARQVSAITKGAPPISYIRVCPNIGR